MNHFASSMLPRAVPADYEQKRSRLLNAIRVLSEQEPPDVLHRIALAEAEFRLAILPLSDLQESIDHLQRAIAYDPLHPKFFFHMGRCLYQSGDFRGAAQEYRHALKLAPGSHRVFVHLALALLELDKEERKAGQTILDALMRGAEHELAGQLALLDDLEKKAQRALSAEQEKGQSSDEEGAPSSAPNGKKEAGSAKPGLRTKVASGAKYPVVESRWKGVWWLALASQLSATKPNQKQMNKALEKGETFLASGQNIAEYAVLCLFQLLDGAEPAEIQGMLEKQLKEYAEDPAVQLVQSALTLKQIPSAELFVESAIKELRAGKLPSEIVCCLHLTKFGTSSIPSVSKALRVLDGYPPDIRLERSFREMRLALLDGYARLAWSEEQYERARLLWCEVIPLDPYRIAIAHNLALVAARTKSYEDYAPAWERAAELRYLYAAAANDVQVCLEERRAMHLAFTQQSKQRHCASSQAPRDKGPTEEELIAWFDDRAALDTWLREWDLYYLNSRLGFRSPMHLLGIARDATEETVEKARDAFIQQINLSLRHQTWAGIQAFCQLAEQVIKRAAERAAVNIERIRDPYYADEMAEADALAQEAIDRGLLQHEMLCVLRKKCPAHYLALGCAIASKLFALPWNILQPLCVRRGMLPDDEDLVAIFENHFMALLLAQPDDSQEAVDLSEQLAALQEASSILPHQAPEFKLATVQILVDADRKAEAYTCALELLSLLPTIKDQDRRATIEKSMVNLIDNLAFGELPDKFLELNSLQTAQETLKRGRHILEQYPRAGGFRAVLAKIMAEVGDQTTNVALMQEAVQLLEQGLPLALNGEQRQRFTDLLKKYGSQQEKIGVRQEIKTLLEGAIERVHRAFEKIQREQTLEALREARQILDQAMRDADLARTLARNAKLSEIEQQAHDLHQQFQDARGQLDRQLPG